MKKCVWLVAAMVALVAVSGAAFASNADFMITLAGQTTPLTAQTINPGQTLSVDVWVHSDDTVNGASGEQIFFAFDSTNSNSTNVGSTEANALNQVLTMVGTNSKVLAPTVLDSNWAESGSGGAFNTYAYFSAAKQASGPYYFGNFASAQWTTGSTGNYLNPGYTDEIRFTLTGNNTGTQTIGLWSYGSTAPVRTSSVTEAGGGGQFFPNGTTAGLVDATNITVAAVVPEPGSVLALGAGLFSLVGYAIRRRK